ncbi:MAG TPA: flagellar biosynthesis protein FlhF [Bacteroidota bacterium]|nr:flagellar biosynthesis protein FlhF [Bacteroidota bacterium]
MKIKKFVAPTLKEATEKMKKELGDNAILLSTRSVPAGGVFSMKGKLQYEITGAVDDEFQHSPAAAHASERKASAQPSSGREGQGTHASARATDDTSPLAALQQLSERFGQERTTARETRHASVAQSAVSSSSIERGASHGVAPHSPAMQAELDELKRSLDDLREEISNSKGHALPLSYRRVFNALTAQDVTEKIAMGIIQPMMDSAQGFSAAQINDRALKALAELIPAAGESKLLKKRSKIIAFVGPTGVGKTTTIAKLSAIFSLVKKMKVALISADTFRIAAIDQLQTFATIASIDMDVAYKPKDMPLLLKKFASKDVIFIDTAGRNQRNPKEIAQLEKILRAAQPDEVHMVLSSTASLRTMRDVVKRFAPLTPNRIIFSKLDEASAFGNIVNLTADTRLPISYLTMGQQVPDDIQAADSLAIAQMIFNGALPDA